MLVDIFDAAPIWVWFAFSFLLGLASYWFYRVCALREARATRDYAMDEWRDKVKDAEGRVLALRTTLAARDAALVDAARLKDDAALGARAKPALEAAEEEVRRLKYDLWIMQTRLARAGAPRGDTESRASERDASKLRYQLWMTQNRLARATSRLEPVRPDAAGPIHLAAASDVDGAGLRYRNWLLARQLSATVSAIKARAPVDLAAIEGALIEAEAPRPSDPSAFVAAPVTEILQEPVDAELASQAAETGRLRHENSGLRYRNWRFATGVGEAISALRGGVEPSQTALEATLAEAGMVEFESAEGEEAAAELGQGLITIAPFAYRGAIDGEHSTSRQEVEVAEASAETLRQRVLDLEQTAQGLAFEAATARSVRAEAVETRRRLWTAEWSRRRQPKVTVPVVSTLRIDPAAIDEASALRVRAGQAEAALRALRGDLSRAEASALTLSRQAEHQRVSVEQTAADEASGWRRRASQAEAALRTLRADLAQSANNQKVQAASLAQVERAQTEAASTRSQLWSAEWRAQKVMKTAAPLAMAAVGVEQVQVAPSQEQPVGGPASLVTVLPQQSVEPTSPPSAVDFSAPLSGVEAAALELIGSEAQPGPPLSRPSMLLSAPSKEGGDNFRLLRTIDSTLHQKLTGLGVHHFDQIAFARPEELAWIDTELDLGGKVVRDRWAPQANYWAALKRAGALVRGGDGLWTQFETASEMSTPAFPVAPGAIEAGREETIDSLPAPRFAENVTQPLSGAEAAALEIIEAGATPGTDTPPTLVLLSRPSIGAADDLTLIRGLGPKLRSVLNTMGIYYFAQIADLAPPDIAWLDAKLAFGGRLVRDRWIPQSRVWRERKALGGLELNAEGFLTALKAPILDEGEVLGSAGAVRAEAPVIKSAPFYSDASVGGAVVMTAPRVSTAMAATGSPDADAVEAARRALKTAAEPAMMERAAALPTMMVDAPMTHAERDAAQLIEAGLGDRPNSRPLSLLDGPLAGPVDDLGQIMGVGPKLAEQLNALGLYYYRQLTQFSGADLAWLDSTLQLEGRLLRERWVVQAEELERRRLYG